jgi:hypothetical protein
MTTEPHSNKRTGEIKRHITDTKVPLPRKRCHKKGFYRCALYKIWHRSYIDRNDFNQDKLLLHQKDIYKLFEEQGISPHPDMYVVPSNPSLPMSKDNVLLVNKQQRKFLIALWRLRKDETQYSKYIDDFRTPGVKQ